MKKKVVILVLLIMLLFSQVGDLNAQEQELEGLLGFINGNHYLEIPEGDRSGYIVGLVDMFWFMYNFTFPEIYKDVRAKMKNMTVEQIQKIFEKFLEEHPEGLHAGASSLFHEAMIELLY